MIQKNLVEYQCDACLKVTYDPENIRNNSFGWSLNTEIGVLCMDCKKEWEKYKEDFCQIRYNKRKEKEEVEKTKEVINKISKLYK